MTNKLKQRLTAPINNLQRRRVDKRKLDPLSATVSGRLEQLSQIGKERVSEQASIPFRERGVFKAFVLAVLSPEKNKVHQSKMENEVFMDQGAPAIIFRIPEMHACLPAPSDLTTLDDKDSFLIEVHPVALPMNDSVIAPKVGAMVDIIYEDPVNMIGPRYVGAVKGQSAEKTNMNASKEDKATKTLNSRFSGVSVSDFDGGINIGAKIADPEEV